MIVNKIFNLSCGFHVDNNTEVEKFVSILVI
jgi:hypothetical protein